MKPLFDKKPKNKRHLKILNIIGISALGLVAVAFVVFVAVLLPAFSALDIIKFQFP